MELLPLAPDTWGRVARVLVDLTAGVGLAIGAAFALLLARVGSLASADAPRAGAGPVLYPVAMLSAVTALFAFARAAVRALGLVEGLYPRLLI